MVARGIDTRYSARSNMPSALVACYGCRNFTPSGIRSDHGDVLLFAAVVDAQSARGFSGEDLTLSDGDIATEIGGAEAYARCRRVRLASGAMMLGGAVGRLELTDVDIRAPAPVPIASNPGSLSGPLAAFRPPHPSVTRTRVRARTGAWRGIAIGGSIEQEPARASGWAACGY